ncbi:MAG TPA: VCBS repeat-containing protein [Candidatus Methylomirabilis sp.]|nr:VCBS repeat-containing protein [Candidatus Methylomirabilis sp.]
MRSIRIARIFLPIVLALVAVGGAAWAQRQERPPAQAPPPVAAPLTVLVDDLVGLFPTVQGEVVEVRDATLTLAVGKKDGARQGLEVELFREGREIRHPKTGAVLGKTEEALGRTRIADAQEAFSLAPVPNGSDVKPGDRFRVSSAKINLVLLPMLSSVRENLVEVALQELVERLTQSGRFRVTMGDPINVFLAQEGIKPEDFLQGKGVKQAAQRFQVDNLLAVHFKRVQGKPYMDIRFFSQPVADPVINTAFFVPATIKPQTPSGRFSAGGSANPPQAKQRSLLARLLGLELDAGSYSSAEGTFPLRQVARFAFPVLALDVSIAPKDKIPRLVVSDGDQVYMYRIVEQKFEPEWNKSVRSFGRVFSVQLADVDGDGVLEVIGNRFSPKVGLTSFILKLKDGKPVYAVDDVPDFLFAVDLKGEGVKRTLWTQRYSTTSFFTPGQADQVILKGDKLVVEKPVRVPGGFRPMGAAFCNIMGKDTRSLAFIDQYNRLQIATEGEDLWRSSTSVGGGYMEVEQQYGAGPSLRSSFFKIEPTPLAVDLDGDGIEEIVVPQNQVREGLIAVVFKGPAGFRLQSVNTGFEGGITALGAFKAEDDTQPTLIAAVVRFNNMLKSSGDTQIIMTVPQE